MASVELPYPLRITIPVVRLTTAKDQSLPEYMTVGAAGVDLAAANGSPLTLYPMHRVRVPCGIKIAVPIGYEGQIRPRSGLALRHGITVLNAPGTIDSDYRGEICVILVNFGTEPFIIQRGDRIAQLVVAPVIRAEFQEVEQLPASERGEGGFGHTGRS